MSNQEARPIANRDEAIPVLSVTTPGDGSGPRTPVQHEARKSHLSASKLKHKLESLGEDIKKESPSRVSDRLFTMLLSQVLPTEYDEDDPSAPKDRRSRKYVDRPQFSLPQMSSNFRRFNARIGVAFVFQNRAIRLFTWRQPTQTLSFLAVYTFLCLDPTLLIVLPLVCILFFVMVPAFLARHPPPPTHLPTDLYPLSGPPLAAAQTIKPAAELSKDFFRNMRDLQNCMEDFSRLHDAVVATLTPLTNFSNESLSSIIYLVLLFSSVLLFISAHLLPWRYIFLCIGYAATLAGHPTIQDLLAQPESQQKIQGQEYAGRALLLTLSASDITLESQLEHREVEIFELQHRALHHVDGEYEAFLFSPSPYAPLSPARVAGDRPRGTPFFEDVQPPRGWRWADKKWTLDLLSREWVEERCVTGVEVEVEGERWVTDLFYGEGEESSGSGSASGNSSRSPKKLKKKGDGSKDLERDVLVKAWAQQRPSRKGEWRRRRWVRGVERMPNVLEEF